LVNFINSIDDIYLNNSIFFLKSSFHLENLVSKVTTPKNARFLKSHTIYFCLKCTPTVHESLWLFLGISIFSILKIRSLFIWYLRNAFEENLKSFIPTNRTRQKVFQYNNGNHVELLIWAILGVVRVTLYLEARPICCVKGQESSFVIGQTPEIGPNPLHLEVGPIWCNKYFHPKRHDLTWPGLVELDAPKIGGQFLA